MSMGINQHLEIKSIEQVFSSFLTLKEEEEGRHNHQIWQGVWVDHQYMRE